MGFNSGFKALNTAYIWEIFYTRWSKSIGLLQVWQHYKWVFKPKTQTQKLQNRRGFNSGFKGLNTAYIWETFYTRWSKSIGLLQVWQHYTWVFKPKTQTQKLQNR